MLLRLPRRFGRLATTLRMIINRYDEPRLFCYIISDWCKEGGPKISGRDRGAKTSLKVADRKTNVTGAFFTLMVMVFIFGLDKKDENYK